MFLTIITPFFNNLDYVKKCIKSLEQQDCKDFELILINDSSTEIKNTDLESLKKSEKIQIKLINNEKNRGPGYSRNQGIEIASGNYLLFLDSDDWLENQTVSLLKEIIDKYKCDCVIFDYYLAKEKLHSASSVLVKRQQGKMTKTDALLYTTGSVCCKVYKTQLLQKHNVRFPEIYIKEDMVFNKKALYCCETIFYLKQHLYYYKIQKNSLMHSEKVFDVTNDIQAFNELEKSLKLAPPILEALFTKELLYAGTLNMLCSNTNLDEIKKFIMYWTKKYPNWEKNNYIKKYPLRMKVFWRAIIHQNWCVLKWIAFMKKHSVQ